MNIYNHMLRRVFEIYQNISYYASHTGLPLNWKVTKNRELIW